MALAFWQPSIISITVLYVVLLYVAFIIDLLRTQNSLYAKSWAAKRLNTYCKI